MGQRLPDRAHEVDLLKERKTGMHELEWIDSGSRSFSLPFLVGPILVLVPFLFPFSLAYASLFVCPRLLPLPLLHT